MKTNIFFLMFLFISSPSFANNHGLESCYTEEMKINDERFDTELFVVVDQTTLFNLTLKQSVSDNIQHFMRPSNGVTLIKFSAYKLGQYTDVITAVKFDSDISRDIRNDISKRTLKTFDRCMKVQIKKASYLVGGALKQVFGGASDKLDKSDVLYSLKAVSLRVKKSKAKRKVVLLASDMLENSSISSFYNRQTVRKIDPEKEMAIVEKNNLFGDFGNAEIYVIGAGLLPEDTKKSESAYRPYQVMKALSSFWQAWFEKSNAKLIEFGQPALLNPIE